MTHLPNLIVDLGLILIAAAAVTIIFKKLKQPVVLGYLIAGMIVGPHFHLLPTVKDTASISVWAEIGVIFMLFGLGLEFSFKKLMKQGKSATLGASFEILTMLGIGYLTGTLLGWSKMDSLFLGGVLSISSTTIIVRAFDELGLKGKKFVPLVFGVLIVEDLIAILLLVLLSSMAATDTLSGAELGFSSLRLIFFIVLWFLLGIYLIPIFLRLIRNFLNDETMLIISIALCLLMVIIASNSGFSPALGAFVMGSLFAETPKGHRIEKLILPVKDLFSAVFFVSVGMLIDPKILSEHFGVVILITFITVFGKVIGTGFGMLVSGQSVKSSLQTGLSLAQIGEFSFIIATLGMTLGVTSDFLYPIVVTVSAVTTFTTPYLIKASGPIAGWLESKIPNRMREALLRYETAMSSTSSVSVASLLWKEYGIKIMLNSVMVVAIALAMKKFALPFIDSKFDNSFNHIIVCLLSLIVTAPFLWAIFIGSVSQSVNNRTETLEKLQRLQFGVSIVRFVIGTAFVAMIVSQYTSVRATSGLILMVVAGVAAFFFSRYSEPVYKKIEKRFVSNLTANERAEIEKKSNVPKLTPWDASLVDMVLSQNSPIIAKTLQQSALKEKFGITIAMIERGENRILAPTRDDLLLPGDRLFLIGTEDQLESARQIIETKASSDLPSVQESFGLASLILSNERFIGKPIRECGLREAINGLIVGIERDGKRILNPDSGMMLKKDDLIWLVGDRTLIKALRS